MKRINMVKQRFGRLEVKEYAYTDKHNHVYWKCQCECGNIKEVWRSDLIKGRVKSCGCLRKEITGNKYRNKKRSKETCQKISKTRIKRGCGKNINITDEDRRIKRTYPEYNEWRKSVYKRDNYSCQICGKYGDRLNAHHIESYASNKELRTTLSNGITLCETCHRDFHHQYGNGGNTKQQFEEFIRRNKCLSTLQ